MPTTKILVPQTNVNDETVLIVEWHIEDGVWADKGDLIVTVETSKAAEEIYVESAGHVFRLAAVGDELLVGASLAYLSDDPDGDDKMKGNIELDKKEINATAKARALAESHNVDLNSLGIKGIITESHIINVIEKTKSEGGKSISPQKNRLKISNTRELTRHQQATARAVLMSQKNTASTFLQGDADVTSAEIRLAELAAQYEIPLSITDLLIYVTARTLRHFPSLNATLSGNTVSEFTDVHLGIAIEIKDNLVIFPLRNTDETGIIDIAVSRMEGTMNVMRGTVKAESLADGTFTVSVLSNPNLNHHVPILYPGQSGILGAGAVRNVATSNQPGEMTIYRSLGLTVTYDHRHINGGYAAAFLQEIADGLAKPQI